MINKCFGIKIMALLVFSMTLGGCGTMITAFGSNTMPFEPYSGLKADGGPCANILDMPFSFALDTVVLPITVPKYLIEQRHGNNEAKKINESSN